MIFKIILSTCAVFCFGFLINIRGRKLIYATLSGCISISCFELALSFGLNSSYATLAATLCFSLYAEIMARIMNTTVTTFSLSGLLPIAPGGTMYLSMDAFVKNDFIQGQAYMVTTINNALILGLGILVVGSFISLFSKKEEKF